MQNIDGLMDRWTTGSCNVNARKKPRCECGKRCGGPDTRSRGEFCKVAVVGKQSYAHKTVLLAVGDQGE